jgi:hypothetical protein
MQMQMQVQARMAREEGELSLRERWRSIEEEEQLDEDDDDDDDDDDNHEEHEVEERRLSTKAKIKAKSKASWFSDAFDFLMKAPASDHIWCHYSDLMAPLLETFHAFPFPSDSGAHTDDRPGANDHTNTSNDSPLVLLWARLSRELSLCTQCVCHHHQALLSYASHYHPLSVAPLLTLSLLDEDRVSRHLCRLNATSAARAPEGAEVVSLMFEVLMFPVLLDDSAVAREFQIFIEATDDSYQVTLSTDQHYPVHSLLPSLVQSLYSF